MTVQIDPEGTETKYLRRFAEFDKPARRRVLEVGCGDGRLTWRYANAAGQVWGIDLQMDDLRIAMVDRPNNLTEIINFAQADAVHLPFTGGAFDLALFAWSF